MLLCVCIRIGLRGATADVVILEEAAFMDKQVFFQVCVPLLGVNHTALLAISTPDDEFNFYSELFDLKRPDGKSMFKMIKIGNSKTPTRMIQHSCTTQMMCCLLVDGVFVCIGLACADCMDNGLQCNHKLDKLPHWKTIERQALISTILESVPELADRETRGVVKSNRRNCFDKDVSACIYTNTTTHYLCVCLRKCVRACTYFIVD